MDNLSSPVGVLQDNSLMIVLENDKILNKQPWLVRSINLQYTGFILCCVSFPDKVLVPAVNVYTEQSQREAHTHKHSQQAFSSLLPSSVAPRGLLSLPSSEIDRVSEYYSI